MPNLIEVQKNSYKWFLEEGLREVFKDVSPITNFAENLILEFTDYSLDESNAKYSLEECKERDATYAAPLRVKVRLINKETGELKEQEIYMGDFPLMTDQGTFIYNGAERVIVSQLVKSPGIYYASDYDKSGNLLFTATVIPNRGAWIEYETDSNNVFSARVDRTRKVPVTVLLKALGLGNNAEILQMFGEDEILLLSTLEKDTVKDTDSALEEIYKKLRPGEPATAEGARQLVNSLFFDARRYDLARVGRYKFNKKLALEDRATGKTLAEDVVSPITGEVLASKGDVCSKEVLREFKKNAVNRIILDIDEKNVVVFSNNMVDPADFISGIDLEEIGINEDVCYDVLCEIIEQSGGDVDELTTLLKQNTERLIPKHILTEDIFASINYIINMQHGLGSVDNIDHLGNRRLRGVGELLQNQFRVGFSRMERGVRERMTTQDLDVITPQALINTKPVVAAVKEFFGSSQLSQFMDQPN
ncbi:MAG: DNA-directed RNA polymerase subunit beta, partial [Clostridia bacterium]|nr:DNA-directed RNA polymerase subunit beta [Clostridia bacterium]